MATYSYSKLETFLGSLVHEVLYKRYKDLGNQRPNSLDEVVTYYRRLW